MGVTAENVAADFHVSRADQDALAAESHHRAAAAQAAGYFSEQILPIEIPGRKGQITIVDTDEHVRPEVRLEDMAKLRPAFAKDGTVTAGNASGINDAAAAVVLASESFVRSSGRTPMGKLIGYAHAGVEPRIMGMGPVPAVRKVLDRTGLKIDDIDVFEVNEAFAAQALAVVRELGLPPERTNPNGSGISLGPPRRRHRRHPDRQVAVRAQAHRRPVRARHDVHRRRPGHRRDLRARLTRPRPGPARPGIGPVFLTGLGTFASIGMSGTVISWKVQRGGKVQKVRAPRTRMGRTHPTRAWLATVNFMTARCPVQPARLAGQPLPTGRGGHYRVPAAWGAGGTRSAAGHLIGPQVSAWALVQQPCVVLLDEVVLANRYAALAPARLLNQGLRPRPGEAASQAARSSRQLHQHLLDDRRQLFLLVPVPPRHRHQLTRFRHHHAVLRADPGHRPTAAAAELHQAPPPAASAAPGTPCRR